MKIAHIVCAFPPYKGGIGNVAYEQAKGLADLGHAVTVFTPYYFNLNNNNNLNFKIIYLKSFIKYGNAAFLPQLFFKLRKFDVVQLHYPFFGATEIVWLAKKLGLIKKLVIFYHMDFIAKNIFFKIFSLINNIIKNNLLNSADRIIVSSLDYVSELNIKKYYKKNKNKFIEIPFGSQFSDVKLEDNFNNKNNLNILFVGALDKAHRFKGVNVLLKAFKKVLFFCHPEQQPCHPEQQPCHPELVSGYNVKSRNKFGMTETEKIDIKLNIVGGGELLQNYIKLTEDLGIINKVNFTGRVSDEELKNYYNNCDFLVLPSTDSGEAFGLVLVEAMSFAKPVIASNLSGVRTVCQNNISGFLVEPGNIDDLADKMLKLIQHKELAQKMGQKGRELVDEKYSWSAHVKKLEEVFHI